MAGLAALGTARGLGAEARVFDTRSVCKEQTESMGGIFLTIELKEEGAGTGGYAKEMSPAFLAAEMALFEQQAAEVDIIITTANIPGKPAPKLITAHCARLMRAGSVIVDLAAENGGNCELTHPGEVYVDELSHVTICGITNFPSLMADQSSTLYATNLRNLTLELGGKALNIDPTNDIIGPALVVAGGKVLYQQPMTLHPAPAAAQVPAPLHTQAQLDVIASPSSPSPSPTAPAHAVQHPVHVHSPTSASLERKEQDEERKSKEVASSSSSTVSVSIGPMPPQSSERDRLLPGGPSGSYSGASNGDAVAIDMEAGAGRDGSNSSSSSSDRFWWASVLLQVILLTVFFAGLSLVTPAAFHLQLLVFVLSIVVGYNLVWSVTPALHTPLMSCTNAISGIIILGLMLQTSGRADSVSVVLALVGIGFATVNICGGFLVTQKMLQMFRK